MITAYQAFPNESLPSASSSLYDNGRAELPESFTDSVNRVAPLISIHHCYLALTFRGTISRSSILANSFSTAVTNLQEFLEELLGFDFSFVNTSLSYLPTCFLFC